MWLQVPTLSMRDVILALDYPDFYLHDVEGLKVILSAYHAAVNAVSNLLNQLHGNQWLLCSWFIVYDKFQPFCVYMFISLTCLGCSRVSEAVQTTNFIILPSGFVMGSSHNLEAI